MRYLPCVLILMAACGSSERAAEPAPTEAPTAEPAPSTPDDETPPEAPAPALRTDLGWTTLPPIPSAAARNANRAALRHHRHGDFERARDGFRQALEATPSHSPARFNLACALTKLGALEEAKAEMETLLLEDLPTFGPRYAADEDLAALRDSGTLDAFVELIERSYAAVMEAGPSLVYHTEERTDPDGYEGYGRNVMQAGVWLHDSHRFVPMGPRVSSTGRHGEYSAVLATRFEPSVRRTLTATARLGSSDMEPLSHIELRAFVAPTGAELGVARPRDDVEEPFWGFTLRFTAEGASWQANGSADRAGHIGPPGPEVEALPRISAGSIIMAHQAIEGVRTDPHRAVLLGDGEATRRVGLSRRHRAFSSMEGFEAGDRTVALGPGHLLVLTVSEGQGSLDGTPVGPYALSRIDRGAATAELLLHGEEDRGTLMSGEEGTAYVQISEWLYRVTASGEPERMPAGLLIGR